MRKWILLKGLALSLFLVISPTLSHAVQYTIAPAVVFMDINRPATETIIIYNQGDTPVRLRAEVVNSIEKNKDIENDLQKYLMISPRILNLRPKQQRLFRVSVRPTKDMPDGSYIGNVLFRELDEGNLAAEKPKTEKEKEEEKDTIGIKLSLKLNTEMTIYADRGKNTSTISLSCKKEKDGPHVVGENTTQWRYLGEFVSEDGSLKNFSVPPKSKFDKAYDNKKASVIKYQKRGSGKGAAPNVVSCN